MKKTKILITGANGYIGTSIIKMLSKDHENIEIIGVCRKIIKKVPNVHYYFLKNLKDDEGINYYLKQCSILIHLAAVVHKKESQVSKDEMYNVNVIATEELVKKSLKAGVKKFIFFSTISVLGSSSKTILNENSKPILNTYYSKSLTRH